MSQVNPYLSTQSITPENLTIRKVKVRPIQLLSRGRSLVGDQYWLFLGITVVGMLIGSAVPFGLLLGAMLVGIFICYGQREKGQRVEFATLFKGFDDFASSFIAVLVLMAASLVVMIPFLIALFAILLLPILRAQAAGGNAPPPEFPLAVIILYPLMILASLLITLPFVFVFQLIADRKMQAVPAIKASVRGVLSNFAGVLGFFIVLSLINMILAIMCYLPAVLFMPISIGAVYVLYRDVYPHQSSTAAIHSGMPVS